MYTCLLSFCSYVKKNSTRHPWLGDACRFCIQLNTDALFGGSGRSLLCRSLLSGSLLGRCQLLGLGAEGGSLSLGGGQLLDLRATLNDAGSDKRRSDAQNTNENGETPGCLLYELGGALDTGKLVVTADVGCETATLRLLDEDDAYQQN